MNNKIDGATSLLGALVALISGLNLHEWGAIFGILFGAISVWITYRKYKEDVALRKEELAYKMLVAKIEAKKLGISTNE
ncbi:HP1 family phage holin [Rodentibacter pneumotropicus]|uniref:Holin n=1 Tax=Rodentibacter pneumotropicus TaxID=758 RepID=A0A4S2Q4K6_9PAST|nr:HP1 family phage holin [Rodentibacter pneumotropicus]NBH76380.1 holin [Rodentibacter pneumotropicus]THA06694.1 holin [Rodentibacter pneumotropicus]THA11552.1 holin [Rodentibacter pneumotropicus]THA14237.1 holin [Rodentibacter pneumotropicus]THA15643.1 holin [Rodentibacter pneumotropicus]